jgi:hypothetical protein
MLWRLEGQRLLRSTERYRAQWQRFLEPWLEAGVVPRPHDFEVDFGMASEVSAVSARPLVIRANGIEVRIGGRIDRVDVADLEDGAGFWVIDYKTGRSSNYNSPDLREFRRLQLTLYALAVEQVLLADRKARPLGLAYWLVADSGPKVVLPHRDQLTWFRENEKWSKVREQLQEWVTTLAASIRKGAFPLEPRSATCTQTCDFAEICRITQLRHTEKQWLLPLPLVP